MYQRKEGGFTLIELMVVIVIVGILGAVAIPKFIQASHKAKVSEVPTVLATLASAAHTYQAQTGSYANASTAGELESTYGVTIGESKFFSYEIEEGGSGSAFTARATLRQRIGNASAGQTITVDDGGIKGIGGDVSEYLPNW